MNRGSFKTLFAVTRPKFLVLVPACLVPGIALALVTNPSIRIIDITIVTLGALMAHVSVNVLNEYQDFRSGLDYMTQKTPFSGGSGSLPARSDLAPAALVMGIGALVLSGLAGIYFTIVAGWFVWIPAVIGALTIVLYTGQINRNPLLCLIAPGIGFGSCMVMGTFYALTGYFSLPAFTASLIPFFLVSNLLLLNQFPDLEADKAIGRRHYPIVIGRPKSAWIFLVFLLATYLTILVAVTTSILPSGALLGLLTVFPALPMIVGIFKNADQIDKLQPYMGINVMITLLTPMLMGVGILFWR